MKLRLLFLACTVLLCLDGFCSLVPQKLTADSLVVVKKKSSIHKIFWNSTDLGVVKSKWKKLFHPNQSHHIEKNKLNDIGEEQEADDGSKGFHLLGFMLGFFLGPLGILLSYFINKDVDRINRVKWAWIGWGAATIIVLLLYAALIVLLLASGI